MVGFAVIALIVSYNLNFLLLRKHDMFSANPIVLIRGLTDSRIRTFFIIFFIAGAILIFYMLVMQNYIKYKSDMQQITPEIETPKAEGQGQYGTAKWLNKKKYSEVFAVVDVEDGSELIKGLVAHGRDDNVTMNSRELQEGDNSDGQPVQTNPGWSAARDESKEN